MRGFVTVVMVLAARQAAADPARPLVELVGNDQVDLAEADSTFRCAAPCNHHFDAGRDLVVAGPGVVPSEPFRLPHADTVLVDVATGSTTMRVAGEVGCAAGAAVLGTGLYVLANSDGSHGLGGGLALAAVPLLVGGALLVNHNHTTVKLLSLKHGRIALDTRRGAVTF